MTTLAIALGVLGAAAIVYLVLLAPVDRENARLQKEAKDYIELVRYTEHVRSMEHELMIAGHEGTCRSCIEKAKKQDYWREVEIAKSNAWEAQGLADRGKVVDDLFAARDTARRLRLKPILDPRWEWIEVTKFGETEPSYVKGRRIV